VLQRYNPQLFEPGDRNLREGLVGKVGQWRTTPERECFLKELAG
jgi:hypothetical protein